MVIHNCDTENQIIKAIGIYCSLVLLVLCWKWSALLNDKVFSTLRLFVVQSEVTSLQEYIWILRIFDFTLTLTQHSWDYFLSGLIEKYVELLEKYCTQSFSFQRLDQFQLTQNSDRSPDMIRMKMNRYPWWHSSKRHRTVKINNQIMSQQIRMQWCPW